MPMTPIVPCPRPCVCSGDASSKGTVQLAGFQSASISEAISKSQTNSPVLDPVLYVSAHAGAEGCVSHMCIMSTKERERLAVLLPDLCDLARFSRSDSGIPACYR
jgi:hypothetical protein